MASSDLVLYHIPKTRSTRPLWLYYELEDIYLRSRSDFPKLRLHKLEMSSFRGGGDGADKPESLLAINPNGKVPAFADGSGDDVTMFESCAIFCYLLRHYDFDSALADLKSKVGHDKND